MSSPRLLLVVATLGSFLSLAPAATAQDDTFRWSGTLRAGQQLEIKNLNGAIHAEAGEGDQVQIVAEKTGRDAQDVRIEVVEHEGGVTVCSVYPAGGDEANVCAPGDRSHLDNEDGTKATVTFRVRVPAGVRVDARTMNGDIEASTSAWAALQTMNGSIEIVLPADASTELQAHTMNGKISSDWALQYADERRRNRAQGQLGAGGRELRLETMNGSIQIRRAS